MAQSFSTTSGTLIIPGVYSTITVQTANGGLSTNGVLVLIGESNSGPDYTQEANLQLNAFGPDQFAAVQAKYGSGRLVDAFNMASTPSDDPQIPGAPSSIILVKTNPSTKAQAELATTYAPIVATSAGTAGNLLYFSVVSAATEVKPTTGKFSFMCPAQSLNYSIRVSGGAAVDVPLAANQVPSGAVSQINGLAAGVTATGGVLAALVVASTGTVTIGTPSGNTCLFTHSVAWDSTVSVGDTIVISSTSTIKGGSSQNAGSWVVINVASNAIFTATKLSDGAPGQTGTGGVVTAPVAVAPTGVSLNADIVDYSPVVIAVTQATVAGNGASLELNVLTTGTDLLNRYCFALSATPVTFLSTSSVPFAIVSATEAAVTMNLARQQDGVNETWTAGGEIAMLISYNDGGDASTCSLVVGATSVTTSCSTSADNLNLLYSSYPTLADLVSYINAQPHYQCSVGSVAIGQNPVQILDKGTYSVGSTFGSQSGRVKDDAYRFAQATIQNTSFVTILGATAGLPAVQGTTYLAGGTLGGTSNTVIQNALLALQNVQLNFVVPLFSQDASVDASAGLTDPSSTYTINFINAAVNTHVLAMSTLKQKKNRQGFLSYRGTFNQARQAASNIASYRCSMTFQDILSNSTTGIVAQFQPWAAAVVAAGMQAAGGYRPIVNKLANISGELQAAGDFNDQSISQMEQALEAGLLPIQRRLSGGYAWVSDQTTYTQDNNFSYNSIQATYITDIVALSSCQQMQVAFIGQSVADVSAGIILSFFEGIMADFVRQKFLAPSSDAPSGFKNASVVINGPSFVVNAEIKIAGALYFGYLQFLVSQVTQTATQAGQNG